MRQTLIDTFGLGILFWLIGYIAGMILFFTSFKDSIGWIMLLAFTPVTFVITWWWFRQRGHLTLQYYAGTGVAWALIAVLLDYLFIVTLFKSTTYYALDIYLYYTLMFLIPVGVGLYLNRSGSAKSFS
jgi:hypothetical protein